MQYIPEIINPTYPIYNNIKKVSVSKYIKMVSKYINLCNKANRQDKINICYNIYYLTYLNIEYIYKMYKRHSFVKNLVEKLFEIIQIHGCNEFILFIPHLINYRDLSIIQQELYDKIYKKYKNKRNINDYLFIFQDNYTNFEDLANDIKYFLSNVNYLPQFERIKYIFNLLVNNQNIIKNDNDLKKDLLLTYHKTNNNLIKYCYLLV
jgi:hypothetical protein